MIGTTYTNRHYLTSCQFSSLQRKLGIHVSGSFNHHGFTPPRECVEIERETITVNTSTTVDPAVSATDWKPTAKRMTSAVIRDLTGVIGELTAHRDRLTLSLQDFSSAPAAPAAPADPTATPPLEELAILLGAGAYWADNREDEDLRDPVTAVRDIAREAHEMMDRLPPVYHAAPAMLAMLKRALAKLQDPEGEDYFDDFEGDLAATILNADPQTAVTPV